MLLAVVCVITRPGRITIAGSAAAAESIVGLDAAAPPLIIHHVGTVTVATAADDLAVAGVLTDLESFWSMTFPDAFAKSFTPLTGGYVSVDSSADAGQTSCVATPGQIAGNAYYCPSGDAIVYDSAGLIPVLVGHYGAAGLTAAFAHEFGHAVQARIGPTVSDVAADPAKFPSILIEAQGDCFAGSFLAWASGGHSDHVRLPVASMVRAAAPLLDFADPVTVAASDATAHGLALDRLTSLVIGYRSGAAACHALTRASLNPTLGRAGLVDTPRPVRFASVDAAMAAGRSSMTTLVEKIPGSSSSAVSAARARPADLAAAKPYGQFAAAAALALAIGRAATGNADDAACFAGAWVGSVFGHAGTGSLGSWGGDADEGLNMLRARPDATWGELAGYSDGFGQGVAACG